MDQTVFRHLQNHIETIMEMGDDCADQIADVAEKLTTALLAGQTIYSCGLDETAPLSQLFVTHLRSGYQIERPGFPAVDLGTVADQDRHNEAFSKSLNILGKSGDILVVFSSGGDNPILQKTIECATEKGIFVILLSALDDHLLSGDLGQMDVEIAVGKYGGEFKANMNFLIIQCLCKLIDIKIFGGD